MTTLTPKDCLLTMSRLTMEQAALKTALRHGRQVKNNTELRTRMNFYSDIRRWIAEQITVIRQSYSLIPKATQNNPFGGNFNPNNALLTDEDLTQEGDDPNAT